MKLLLNLFMLLSIVTYGQDDSYKDWIMTQNLPLWSFQKFNDFKLEEKYKISDYMNPFYLQADFNDDDQTDIAICVIEISTNKKGFVIIHGQSDNYFLIGAGVNIGNGGDDFNWMDIWKIDNLEDKIGLHVEKSESASALITWNGVKYIWIQKGD